MLPRTRPHSQCACAGPALSSRAPAPLGRESDNRADRCRELRGPVREERARLGPPALLESRAEPCPAHAGSRDPEAVVTGERAEQTFNPCSPACTPTGSQPARLVGWAHTWGSRLPPQRAVPHSRPPFRALSHTPELRAELREASPTAKPPQGQPDLLENRAKHSSKEGDRIELSRPRWRAACLKSGGKPGNKTRIVVDQILELADKDFK